MAAQGAVKVLRERIGYEATDALIIMTNESTRSMAEQMMKTTGDRFERRLTEELSTLRVEMHTGFAALRAEIAGVRTEIIRWSFLFWIAQMATVVGILAYTK